MDAMNRSPDVSVVMSVYNGAAYLRQGLDSILSQEGVEFEFVIVDDGSNDDSPRILAEAAARDPRVRVLRQENTGLTRALIRACAEARGRFIARQDGDDLSLPGRLRRQMELLDGDPSVCMASSWGEVIGPGDEILLSYQRPVDPADATQLLMHGRVGPPGHGSVMFRRDAYEQVGGYRELFYYAQDSDLWLRMGMVGRIAYVQDVLYRYRVSPESISGRLDATKQLYANLVTELHEARLRGEDEAPILAAADLRPRAATLERSSADVTDCFIARCLLTRRDPRAHAYVRRALARNPRNLRAWLLWLPTGMLSFANRAGAR
jgi:glycosyltransferase involved in cell wall biosynthesis